MGEAIMASVGRSGVLPGLKWKLQTRIYTKNDTFVMPGNVRDNEIRVMCYGGGGGVINNTYTSISGGGGGGWMNIITLNNINTLQSINITIGKGTRSTGGTTTFGNYVSANGGRFGNCYTSADRYGTSGGDGGSGGGGGCCLDALIGVGEASGGRGYQFGGGGTGGSIYIGINGTSLPPAIDSTANQMGDGKNVPKAGNGGKWGGGGGCSMLVWSSSIPPLWCRRYYSNNSKGIGGALGGNGSLTGNGNKGTDYYDDNTVLDKANFIFTSQSIAGEGSECIGGAGGGFGGCGGKSTGYNIAILNNAVNSGKFNVIVIGGAGGGGGYCSNGGNGNFNMPTILSVSSPQVGGGGGGGGFGGKGADANGNRGGGGGGYGPSNY